MRRPPLLHPLHIFRATEVIAVVRFAQPFLLTGPLAGGLTLRVGTIFLPPPIPVIRNKNHLAVQTFAAGRGRFHPIEKSPSLKARRDDRKPEEKPAPKKTEKEEKKRFGLNVGKKTEPEENNNFKPAFSPRFQPASDTVGGCIEIFQQCGGLLPIIDKSFVEQIKRLLEQPVGP